MHSANSFVTLTYDDHHLPPDRSLRYPDVQLFLKRVRRRYGRVRYYLSGEYGDRFGRPHYHALLFGLDWPDRVFYKRGESGADMYESKALNSLWGMGQCLVGDVTFESAAYCARYVMKKELGVKAGPRRCILDVTTGELVERDHEFCRMSLKPALGWTWFQKYWRDVFPHDYVVVLGGTKLPVPRRYDIWYSQIDPIGFEEVQYRRQLTAARYASDNTDERLAVKELVLKARVGFLKREI